ncbi:hypothetical protein PMAYCL1PPCAC_07242, partial [Pristionchus mayeri]
CQLKIPICPDFLMRGLIFMEISGLEMRVEEENEEELKELWKERMEAAMRLEEEIRSMSLSRESNILGKVKAEVKSLQRASRNLTRQSIDDGNLRHFRNVVDVATREYDRIDGLLRSFVLVDPKEGELYKHVVDIVSEGGAVWAKVISRTAKGVAMDWLTSSPRTVVQQGTTYIQHSLLFPHNFNPPLVVFHFENGVPHLVAEKLERMGVTVEGERIRLEDLHRAPEELLEELMKEESEDEEKEGDEGGETEEIFPPAVSSTAPVNLDVSAVFVLISNLTHPGGCDHKFSSALLRQQCVMERKVKAREQLFSLIEGREWVVCETTLEAVNNIVNTVGGPTEKRRWTELQPRIRVLPDSPSERSLEMEQTVRLNDRSIKIFGTGDELKYVTASANKHFVQSAFHQGVHYAVILHESRALSEQKELPL